MRAVALCLAAALALAQVPTGTIAGVVTDPSGSTIPNARVTILNQETGLTRAVETQAGGDYSVPAPPAGTYQAKGFSPAAVRPRLGAHRRHFVGAKQ